MADTRSCSRCGTVLPEGSQFCPKCGEPVVYAAAEVPPAPAIPPPARPVPTATTATTTTPITAASAPPPPAKSRMWLAVPIAIVALIVIAWLLLAGLPFGGEPDRVEATTAAAPDTVAEGYATGETGTIVDAPGVETTETTQPPPMTATSEPQIIESTPPPTRTQPPPVRTQPRPAPTRTVVQPPPAAPPPAREPEPEPAQPAEPREPQERSQDRSPAEMSEAQTAATLRSYITSRNYEGVSSNDCLSVSSQGYSNRGYAFSVNDTCGGRSLGSWRVDTLTREVFRQRGDGRYLRP